ncbi:MAG: hypothetical protein SPF22_07380 [Candidatus Onthovivens sp.]|nr:hypothetical protein [Candidatus Onthovivens sp.]
MRNIDLFIDKEKANLIEVDSFRDIQSIDINKYKNGKINLAYIKSNNTVYMYDKSDWLYLNINMNALPVKLDIRFMIDPKYRNFLSCLASSVFVTFDDVLIYAKEGNLMVLCIDSNHCDNTIYKERLVFEI